AVDLDGVPAGGAAALAAGRGRGDRRGPVHGGGEVLDDELRVVVRGGVLVHADARDPLGGAGLRRGHGAARRPVPGGAGGADLAGAGDARISSLPSYVSASLARAARASRMS